MHGGLSPEISTLDQIRTIKRFQEIPHQGSLCGTLCPSIKMPNNYFFEDLVWSDPEELESGGWAISQRGAGYLFGNKVTSDVNNYPIQVYALIFTLYSLTVLMISQ